jgi:transposase
MVIGIDAHKRSHTAFTVDEMGRQGFVKTIGTTTHDHLRLLNWAVGLATERLWAIEDCRHLTRRLERDVIAATASPIRLTPWRWPGPRCGNRTCRSPVSTGSSARSGC